MHEPNQPDDGSLFGNVVLLVVAVVGFLVLVQFGLGTLVGGLFEQLLSDGFPPAP